MCRSDVRTENSRLIGLQKMKQWIENSNYDHGRCFVVNYLYFIRISVLFTLFFLEKFFSKISSVLLYLIIDRKTPAA